MTLDVLDLGQIVYASALLEQRRVHQAVLERSRPPTLLLAEHDPVITISQRRSASDHLVATTEELDRLGIDLQRTDRGGDITYHGPGQLVAYPILHLGPLGLNLGRYMRFLEQVVIETLESFGVAAHVEKGLTGVWVNKGETAVKICAIGIRVRKNVTMHGLSLNVCPDLSHFQTIVPCGLVGRSVTSLFELVGRGSPSMQCVKDRLVQVLCRSLQDLGPDLTVL